MWQQRIISLRPRERGFHLVTEEVLEKLPELAQIRVGLLHLWLQHTSASLTVNENADPAVRRDFERFFNRLVPQGRRATNTITKGRMICRRTSRAVCWAFNCSCRYRMDAWRWAPGRGSTWASIAIMAVLGEWWRPCTAR